MIDVFKVASILTDNAVEKHGSEIDLIAYTGSHARGEARDDSDLDIYYVPADGKNPPVGRTFLLEGLLFDFWGISWQTMHGFATGRSRGWSVAPALIYHSKILYARNSDQKNHLHNLKQQIDELQQPESKPQMVGRALRNFSHSLAHEANMSRAIEAGNTADARYAGWNLVQSVWESLALANQVFFDRGFSKALGETEKFNHKPDGLSDLVAIITTNSDPNQILIAGKKLVRDTRSVLRQIQDSIQSEGTDAEWFRQVYPEMRDKVGKVLAACQRGDTIAAHAEAMFFQKDITMMLNASRVSHDDFNLHSELAERFRKIGFPDLLDVAGLSLDELATRTTLFDERLRDFLTEQSVDLCELDTLEELKAAVQQEFETQ